ncbi:MAG: glucose-1-phosphate cytidylyltransferase [Candidatus Peregrinibacteria bacterium]|nr:glucose-1-phosphate cytidylyltransferase [Candidatus Peregrinibacteria bacterium]
MQVVILCGGLGTRLKEETEFRPKPMVNIGPWPILWHIMKLYAHFGYKDFILALGYKGDVIKEYFNNYELMNNDVTLELGRPDHLVVHQKHNDIGWKITLVNTGEATLKGARLKRVEKYIEGDDFMVTYGDSVANVDLDALVKFHHEHGKLATVTAVTPASRFGELTIKDNLIESFVEKPKVGSVLTNGGYFVFKKEILGHLSEEENCDLEYGVLEKLAHESQLMAYKHNGFWECMDTFRDMEYLNRLWNEGKAEWKIW